MAAPMTRNGRCLPRLHSSASRGWIALALLAAIAACKDEKQSAPTEVRPVRTTTVTPRSDSQTATLTGVIEARYEADIGFRVNGKILWANLALLFWLSLIPFVIRWLDETGFVAAPTAAYGVVLACAGLSYTTLQRQIIALNGRESQLALATGDDLKGKLSIALYLAAIVLAFVWPWVAILLYVIVSLMWLVPDKRIESLVGK